MSKQLDQDARAQQRLDRALAALDAHLPRMAIDLLEKVLEIQPHNLTARIALSRAQLAMNQPADALTALDAAGFYDPQLVSGPQAGLLRAQALLCSDRHELARGQLNRVIELCPDDDRAYRMMVELCLKDNDQSGAIEHLTHVRRLAPSDHRAGRMLAHLLQTQDPQASAQMIESDDPASQLRIARMHRLAGRDRDAEEIYQHLLKQQTEDDQLWLEAGQLSDESGADAQAIMRLEKAVSIGDQNRVAALCALAQAHMHAGRFSTAGHHWWQVTRHEPTHVAAWAGLLVCALHCDRPRIIKNARRNLERQTSKVQRREQLALMWQHAAMGEVIAKTNQPLAAKQPTEPTLLDQLLHSAAHTFAQNAKKYPGRADTHYHLAVCQNAIDDESDAKQNVLKALEINPNYRAAQSLDRQIDLPDSRAA